LLLTCYIIMPNSLATLLLLMVSLHSFRLPSSIQDISTSPIPFLAGKKINFLAVSRKMISLGVGRILGSVIGSAGI
jgi:hypothetical protein